MIDSTILEKRFGSCGYVYVSDLISIMETGPDHPHYKDVPAIYLERLGAEEQMTA
jgi:hypothetical protein